MAPGWNSNLRLDGKTVIITGASSGLGKCAAMDFYKRGARVVMPCLDIKEGQMSIDSIKRDTETANKTGELILKKLDLSSLESVKECATELLREETRIDLLVNNAGVLITEQKLSKDGFQIHFAVNYLGHFLFTVLLLPRLIRSSPARIVNTASGIYLIGKPIERDEVKKEHESESKAYANSKLAVILFTMELAEMLQGTGVNVYCFHPGLVRTPMAKSFLKTFNVLTRTIIKVLAYPVRKSSYEGAQTLLYCALDEKLNSETGFYYSECRRRETGSKTADPKHRRELWDMTIEILGLDDINLFKSD